MENSAVEQLRSMFSDFDEETLRTVLAANSGNVERTIEDLLKMTSENSGAPQQPVDDDDDNLFADPRPAQGNQNRVRQNDDHLGFGNPSYQGNQGGLFDNDTTQVRDERYAKEMQEQEDAALAYRLQQKYMQQEAQVEQAERERQRRQQAVGRHQQNRPNTAQNQSHNPNVNANQSQPQPQNYYSQQPLDSYGAGDSPSKKKKTGFMSKVKAGFSSVFGGKKNKKGPSANPGQFAEIDNLDDNEVIHFGDHPQSNDNNHNNNNYNSNSYNNHNNNSHNNRASANIQAPLQNFNLEENEVYHFNNQGALNNNNANTGLHQFIGHNEQNNDDAPMQLSDVLNSSPHDSGEEDNHDFNNNNNNNPSHHGNNNQGVTNEHFNFL